MKADSRRCERRKGDFFFSFFGAWSLTSATGRNHNEGFLDDPVHVVKEIHGERIGVLLLVEDSIHRFQFSSQGKLIHARGGPGAYRHRAWLCLLMSIEGDAPREGQRRECPAVVTALPLYQVEVFCTALRRGERQISPSQLVCLQERETGIVGCMYTAIDHSVTREECVS